ncbi:hypothetical protein HYZ76_01365 [Candidatus Falkowbacteria bacterium]|nr:hypothetical protein [Candidatus Falkowbacteria bacterium]
MILNLGEKLSIKLILVASLITSFIFSKQALAAGAEITEGLNKTAESAALSTGGGSGTGNLANFVGGVINVSFGLIAAIFVTIILVGGYQWMTSSGNEEGITIAKKRIVNGLFGLVIVFTAYALVFIISLALGRSIGEIAPPS